MRLIFSALEILFFTISNILLWNITSIGIAYIDEKYITIPEAFSYTIYLVSSILFLLSVQINNKITTYIKRTLYATAYSYVVYLFLHNSFIKDIFKLDQDFFSSPLISPVSILISSVLVGIIPAIWNTIKQYIKLGVIADRAGLFLSHTKANDMKHSNDFKEYINSLQEIKIIKFKCITGYETFAKKDATFHHIFESINHITDTIEIILCNPDGKGIKKRAKILSKTSNLQQSDILKDLQNEIKLTLGYLNELRNNYGYKIKIRFCDDIEVKYKILIVDSIVFIQGYFGEQDIKQESIFAFKDVQKQVSMYKFLCKLFDEKFNSSIKITKISDEYKNL